MQDHSFDSLLLIGGWAQDDLIHVRNISLSEFHWDLMCGAREWLPTFEHIQEGRRRLLLVILPSPATLKDLETTDRSAKQVRVQRTKWGTKGLSTIRYNSTVRSDHVAHVTLADLPSFHGSF